MVPEKKRKLILRKDEPVYVEEKFLHPSLVRRLASKGCTITEIANILGCNEFAITGNETLRRSREIGMELMKLTIRHKQVQIALAGNVQMLIWLGKQYLNQGDADKEDAGDHKKPISININFVKAKLTEECGDKDQQKLLQETSITVN